MVRTVESFDRVGTSLFEVSLRQSSGVDGYGFLSPESRRWAAGLAPSLPDGFTVHDDAVSHEVTRRLGVNAFVRGTRIFLGAFPLAAREPILRHELVHLAQVQLAIRNGAFASSAAVEREAELLSQLPQGVEVRCGADPEGVHPIFWFVAIGVGLYVLLRPGVANAPGSNDKPLPSPPMPQIVAEAICLFAVPGGAMALGPRLGLGFLASSALAGAATNVSLRAVSDVAGGQLSPPLMYLFDASTGAVIGFVVPGGIRLIGQAGNRTLDTLASYGLKKSEIALTGLLAERAAQAPLTAAEAQQLIMRRGLGGQVSKWWLDRRGLILLYRGQEVATNEILSPLGRTQGVAASEALVARLRQMGMSYPEIAGYTARWHDQAVPAILAPPGLGGTPLGAVGIPTTRIPGIAANFGDEGIIYVIRIPRGLAHPPQGWQGLQLENEMIILNKVPPGAVVQAIPARQVAPLMVDEAGLLVPGKGP
jgi:hypothetical protein